MIFLNTFFRAVLLIFFLGVLSSCDQEKGDQGPGPNPDPGLIEVTIQFSETGDPEHPDTGQFIFTPYTAEVPENAKNVPIRLKIISDGYSFSEDISVAFSVTPVDWNILPQLVGPNKKTLMIISKNRKDFDYKYGVVIVRDLDGQEFVIDPRIKNGGGATYFEQ